MPFLNGKVCPPATSEAGARRQLEQYFMSYLSIYFYCSTLVDVGFPTCLKCQYVFLYFRCYVSFK
jgi:hypothetical protein